MNKATIRRKLRRLQQIAQPSQQQIAEQNHLEQLLREKAVEENPLLFTPTSQNFIEKPFVESDWS